MSYFRKEIDEMSGYVPGEQPRDKGIIKLNTNENPFPPSPAVEAALKRFDSESLRLYPDPVCDRLRDLIAGQNRLARENVIVANGSDEILTMVFRCFTDKNLPMACFEPTYSLYPTLAEMQGAPCVRIPLNEDFSMPSDALKRAAGANLLVIARPNAPTGNSFPKAGIEALCKAFAGIVLIDEAYADFADDNCADLAVRVPNVIVSRTLSKSFSLAGLRLGFAMASKKIIDGMMKTKDSYNVDRITQEVALASIADLEYLRMTTSTVRRLRDALAKDLAELSFKVVPSQANFVFASPPGGDGEAFFKFLRESNILVRYFPGEKTGGFVRVTIGTEEQMKNLVEKAGEYVK